MATGPVHRVERVALREVWPREQQDFSRWLAENLDFLNDQLPFDIDPESVHAEQAAGDFWVDIVGEATAADSAEPFKVIIENQLERTDHDHLGKVLTYVAAYGAKAAIWLSAMARPEHAKAVQWLNDESSIDAWLLDVEVIRIAESPEAPLLRQIVGPSALSRRAKAEKQAAQENQREKRAFWQVVVPKVAEACRRQHVWQGRRDTGGVHVTQAAPNSVGKVGWQMWVTKHGSWICLYVDGADATEVAHYYEQLAQQSQTIEAVFGGTLKWERLPNAKRSTVRWDNPESGGFRDDPDKWFAVGDAMADAMARLLAATQPHIGLGKVGFDWAAWLGDATEKVLVDDDTRRDFLRRVDAAARQWKAVKPHPAATETQPEMTVVVRLAQRIRAVVGTPDISGVMSSVEQLLEESVAAHPFVIDGDDVKRIDLTTIDFDALAARFAAGRRNTATQQLRATLERKIDELARLNPTRVDYAAKLREAIDRYNAGSASIESLFAELTELARSLGDEELRHVREGLTEEELAIFDLLTRPDPTLTAAEEAQVKAAVRSLLARLKWQVLVLDWKKRQQTRSAVDVAIANVLDAELPDVYDPDLFAAKKTRVFRHIYESYQGAGRSIYEEVA